MIDTPEKPDAPSQKDWRSTVFLPKTDFPMKAGLAQKEPAILDRWAEIGLYDRLREQRSDRERFILHDGPPYANRSEEHTSELQSLMRISYAVFCLNTKNIPTTTPQTTQKS